LNLIFCKNQGPPKSNTYTSKPTLFRIHFQLIFIDLQTNKTLKKTIFPFQKTLETSTNVRACIIHMFVMKLRQTRHKKFDLGMLMSTSTRNVHNWISNRFYIAHIIQHRPHQKYFFFILIFTFFSTSNAAKKKNLCLFFCECWAGQSLGRWWWWNIKYIWGCKSLICFSFCFHKYVNDLYSFIVLAFFHQVMSMRWNINQFWFFYCFFVLFLFLAYVKVWAVVYIWRPALRGRGLVYSHKKFLSV